VEHIHLINVLKMSTRVVLKYCYSADDILQANTILSNKTKNNLMRILRRFLITYTKSVSTDNSAMQLKFDIHNIVDKKSYQNEEQLIFLFATLNDSK